MIDNLYYHIQKVLPAVHDDSLSMYELVQKVILKVDEVVNHSNTLDGNWKQKITDTLTQWNEDGTLSTLLMNGKVDLHNTTLRKYVPTDYPTLQAAIDDLSGRKTKQGAIIEVVIKSGHKLSSGFRVANTDCGHIWIKSEDPVVFLSETFTGTELFRGDNSIMPRLACLVDMESNGTDGYHVNSNSHGYIEQYCGIKNAGGRCGYVNMNSSLHAYRAILTGAGETGLWVSRASNADCEEADFSGAANEGLMSRRASTVHCQTSIFKNCGQAMISSRSWINAEAVTIENTTAPDKHAVVAEQGGVCIISSHELPTTLKNLAGGALRAHTGGTIPAAGVTIDTTGFSPAIMCAAASRIAFPGSTLKNVQGVGVDCYDGSVVDVSDALISVCTGRGIQARRGGQVAGFGVDVTFCGAEGVYNVGTNMCLEGSTITNNYGAGVLTAQGGKTDLKSATVRNNLAGQDYRVSGGSHMYVNGVTSTNGLQSLLDTNVAAFNTMYAVGTIYI